ncbi:MAG: hypothetical protein JWN96_2426 [Mycobacterium sp.]|nr:hypothetical protein [Mycobacterium sp.]
MVRLVESKIEFPYKRSLGPVIGPFSAALAEHRITAVRTSTGRVICPPLEYDPETGEGNDPTPIDVGPAGTVTSWTWVPDPLPIHPLSRPFAFALIKLDGADTEMFHAVDAGSETAITRGTRVVPQWREETRGRIDDLAYFVPEDTAPPESAGPAPATAEPFKTMEHWVALTYKEAVAPSAERFADGLLAGKLIGQKCPSCGRTYVPPKDACTVDGIPLTSEQDVALPDHGVITNYTIVTPVQYPGQLETEPFARVSVLLDDADAVMSLQAPIGIPVDEVHPGIRVKAVWAPEGERNVAELGTRSWGSVDGCIEGWERTGEPDAEGTDIGRVF